MARILEPALPALAGLGPVRIIADRATNSLVVQAAPADRAALEPIVSVLDRSAFAPAEVSLPRILVDSLFAACPDEADTLALYCHVVEGYRCFQVPAKRIDAYAGRYDAALEANGLPAGLTRLLVLVIDPRRIEHARGDGVKLRCRRPGPTGRPDCAVDWGWGGGWERVAVPDSR